MPKLAAFPAPAKEQNWRGWRYFRKMLGNYCPPSGAHLQNSQCPVISPPRKVPGQRAVGALSLPWVAQHLHHHQWGTLCSAWHYWGWQFRAGSSSSAQEWGKERWKHTPRLVGHGWGCRHISPTSSSASPFLPRARARGFNVSRSITNHLSCGFGFAEASPPPLAV